MIVLQSRQYREWQEYLFWQHFFVFSVKKRGARASYLACVDVKRILREKIYDKMIKIGASYREHVSSSEVVQVSTEGVEQLETYFGKYLPQLFYSTYYTVTILILCRISIKASAIPAKSACR